jgi:hypothetical protein
MGARITGVSIRTGPISMGRNLGVMEAILPKKAAHP